MYNFLFLYCVVNGLDIISSSWFDSNKQLQKKEKKEDRNISNVLLEKSKRKRISKGIPSKFCPQVFQEAPRPKK